MNAEIGILFIIRNKNMFRGGHLCLHASAFLENSDRISSNSLIFSFSGILCPVKYKYEMNFKHNNHYIYPLDYYF